MKEKNRDLILGALSAAGIFFLVFSIFTPIQTILFRQGFQPEIVYGTIIGEFLVATIIAYLVWKKIRLTEDYSRNFIIFFFITLSFQILLLLLNL